MSNVLSTSQPVGSKFRIQPTNAPAFDTEVEASAAGGVTSVFGRVGAVVAAVGDYLASQVNNDSTVVGATVAAALNTLAGLVNRFQANWGTVAAAAAAGNRFIPRTNGALLSTIPGAEYPFPSTGTFTFTLTWRVSGTPLAVDSVTVHVMVNGVASALTVTVPPSTTSGQASASLAVAAGDGIAIRTNQSAAEAQAAWNFNVSLRATG